MGHFILGCVDCTEWLEKKKIEIQSTPAAAQVAPTFFWFFFFLFFLFNLILFIRALISSFFLAFFFLIWRCQFLFVCCCVVAHCQKQRKFYVTIWVVDVVLAQQSYLIRCTPNLVLYSRDEIGNVVIILLNIWMHILWFCWFRFVVTQNVPKNKAALSTLLLFVCTVSKGKKVRRTNER